MSERVERTSEVARVLVRLCIASVRRHSGSVHMTRKLRGGPTTAAVNHPLSTERKIAPDRDKSCTIKPKSCR